MLLAIAGGNVDNMHRVQYDTSMQRRDAVLVEGVRFFFCPERPDWRGSLTAELPAVIRYRGYVCFICPKWPDWWGSSTEALATVVWYRGYFVFLPRMT